MKRFDLKYYSPFLILANEIDEPKKPLFKNISSKSSQKKKIPPQQQKSLNSQNLQIILEKQNQNISLPSI